MIKDRRIINFIKSNYKGVSSTKMAKLCCERFSRDFTVNEIKHIYRKYDLKSGVTGYFETGVPAWNKNKPISEWNIPEEIQERMKIGRFKKGCQFRRGKPIGSETLSPRGFVWIKTAEPNVWERKHVWVWEKQNGKIPPSHYLIFIDGDRTNCDINNLMLVSRKEGLKLNRLNWRFKNNSELQKVALNTVRLDDVILEKDK